MDEDPKEQTVEESTSENTAEPASDEGSKPDDRDSRTWYPYITKAQFEKFLARMQSKMPEEINRDYIRAIIRTPSMIYRFLRGIEAMKLIDPDQKPTERMVNLVNAESRRQTITEIMRDLYPDLTETQAANGDMSDKDIVTFFRKETGMGNDSANKMKMFYKYLLSEAEGQSDEDQDAEGQSDEDQDAESQSGDDATAETAVESTPTDAATPSEAPARNERNATPAEATSRSERNATPAEAPSRSERNATPAAAPARNERNAAEAPSRSERGPGASRRGQQRAPAQSNGGEQSQDRGSASPDRGTSGGSRPLSEAQRAYLDTLKSVLRVNIDGDWDDDMIRLAFDRLERLFDRVKRG